MKVIAMARDNMITIIRAFLAKELLNVHMSLIISSQMSIPHRGQADLQLHERVLSQLICHLMLPTFYLPGFRKSGPFPLSLKTNQIGYKPRSLAKTALIR
jgi:hypothetical protein